MMSAAVAGAAGAWAYSNRQRELLSLKGRTALITGGSRGLGLAMASELAAHGCRLALVARDADRLDHVADDPRLRHAEVLLLPCDVGDREQVEDAIEAAVDHFGGLDILINNAGVIQVGPAAGMTMEDYREAADVIYWGSLHAIMAALPHFRRQGHGSIVNITSIGGKVSVPHLAPYSAAKFALVGLSEGLTAELSRENIHVMTVVPGLMRTGGHLNAQFRGRQSREFQWFTFSANAPGLSMSPAHAAKRIVRGIQLKEREIVLSAPAKLLCGVKNLAPGVVALASDIANLLLPSPPAGTTEKLEGRSIVERNKGLSVRAVERLGRPAALRYQ